MATFDIPLLSSSPPSSGAMRRTDTPPPRAKTATYSPMVLSPLGSPKKTSSSALRTGSRAAPVPEGASRGFDTAGSLVKSRHFSLDLDDEFAGREQGQSCHNYLHEPEKPAKKPRKTTTKATDTGDDAVPKPKKPRSRKPRTNETTNAENAASPDPQSKTSLYFDSEAPDAPIAPPEEPAPATAAKAKAGRVRKPRAKKEKTENDETTARLKKPKVTKAKSASKSGEKAKAKATGAVSSHFHTTTENSPEFSEHLEAACNRADEGLSIWDVPPSPPCKTTAPKPRPPDSNMPLELDEAITRRRDWTPPVETKGFECIGNLGGKENTPIQSENHAFTDMLTTFAFAEEVPQTKMETQPPSVASAGVTKRRRKELVDIPGNQPASRNSSPEKGKAPKKKARTITDLVTEQYTTTEPQSEPHVAGAFFESRTTTKVPLKDPSEPGKESDTVKKPRRKRATSQSTSEKEKEKGTKSKKGSAKTVAKPKSVAEKLLSPASATLRISNQDVLFGTWSQLALEDSPTTVRQIQKAPKHSEQDADMLEGCGLLTDAAFGSRAAPWPRLGKVKGKRDLWAASARDDGGQMLQKEDVYLPEPDRTQDVPLLLDGACDIVDESIADIDDFYLPDKQLRPALQTQVAAIVISSDGASPPRHDATQKEIVQDEHTVISVSFDDIDNYELPPPSNQNVDSSFLDIDDFPLSAQSPPSPLPIPTTASTSAGSPINKKRGRPPKSQPAIPVPRPLKSPSKVKNKIDNAPPRTPTKPSRFADVEEILDSEDDEALSPTPPRTARLQDSPPLPLVSSMPSLIPKAKSRLTDKTTATDGDLVHVYQVPTSQLLWAGIKDEIFKNIAQHIKSLEPTTDPQHPSWHEKILMYDPIVLEDFTTYLNTHTSIRTYRRATMKQVKAWNKAQKAKGEDVLPVIVDEVDGGEGEDDMGKIVHAVTKELETYMVQAWCQEMSICCISVQNKGKGSARKGLY
ncbi:hypothetical protein P154DRAFT_559470 [Amniculicola lignicola CBS 123094]|uniref:Structure-specific endonuclease subunit SLX4 n=1 Tax=Amniculicola lignicola CBS 123094 TaxID=1392246 RepID=A0A6A5X126_9PLEO|nr:hypothetical protein P154DRAFT_559470 [Amniculicola lignicola CBS 123094]